VETASPPFVYGVDAYLDWVKREGLRVHEGLALNLFQLDVDDWPRYGVPGAALHFLGRGDFNSMFLWRLPAGGATHPVQHLFEAICIVLDGRGSTQFEFADGRKRSFEWGRGSMFAIPLNARYRHFNASGQQRALLCATTTAPLMLKVFHNDDFVFDAPYTFADRIGKDEYYAGEGDLYPVRRGTNVWVTNFVPDLNVLELYDQEARGKGSLNILFSLGDGIMHAHMSEIAPATYKKAHRHAAGTHVLTLTGGGYSLLWYEDDRDFTRVDWEYGVVFPPLQNQFHQHFVTSNHPSRYVAVGMAGIRYPLTAEYRRIAVGRDGEGSSQSLSVKEGGDQIEYEDQDSRIHEIWLEEMRERGITPLLELPAAPRP
jgi:mannose-6-phosphate isomerase-like protein (cupin superfamily)